MKGQTIFTTSVALSGQTVMTDDTFLSSSHLSRPPSSMAPTTCSSTPAASSLSELCEGHKLPCGSIYSRKVS